MNKAPAAKIWSLDRESNWLSFLYPRDAFYLSKLVEKHLSDTAVAEVNILPRLGLSSEELEIFVTFEGA